ncbi:hypothetical protein [Paraburkholderia sp. J67]|uniref:hypothetical protein n=1 Tax=Paraburkholderia sp. J67 TaxID=2805435 RepID=UPI002ABE3620|nr:hypothetical protein [Paraburkholderia sp. J67]
MKFYPEIFVGKTLTRNLREFRETCNRRAYSQATMRRASGKKKPEREAPVFWGAASA